MLMGCSCGNTREQNALYEEIGMISFVADELRLYLDTHPDCREAHSMMCEYLAQRSALMNEYREKYGSLEGYEIGHGSEWTWNDPPMPWEMREGGC